MHIWPPAQLARLAQQGYLCLLATPTQQQQAQAKNEQWQHKLAKQKTSFLVSYDLLFRQITRLLIAQGYDFSTKHPHQTLKKLVLMLNYSISEIELNQLIECRHNVKYGYMNQASNQAQDTLAQLGQFLTSLHT
ncbi:MAG: hypothetical protein IPP76_09565 [Moraxellaceae bacterium]|jgi:hypothetical protein|nr:hypothetical protein [Moraxellaceae bacterium]